MVCHRVAPPHPLPLSVGTTQQSRFKLLVVANTCGVGVIAFVLHHWLIVVFMLISLCSPPPCHLTQLPSPPLLAPPLATVSGNGVHIVQKLCSKLLSMAMQTPKNKMNAQAFYPTSWWQLDPLGKLVQWGGGPIGWILCSGGGGRRLTPQDTKKYGGTWYWSHLEPRMHTLALCTLNGTNRHFISPSFWVFQWD
jgi:hypothetical protein